MRHVLVCMRNGLPTSAIPCHTLQQAMDWLQTRGFTETKDARGYRCWKYSGEDRVYLVDGIRA